MRAYATHGGHGVTRGIHGATGRLIVHLRASGAAAMTREEKAQAAGERAFPGVWVVPPVDGLPRCALCLFWRDPELGPRIGIMCGPAVELGEWDESTEVGAMVAAWRRLLAKMGSEKHA